MPGNPDKKRQQPMAGRHSTGLIDDGLGGFRAWPGTAPARSLRPTGEVSMQRNPCASTALPSQGTPARAAATGRPNRTHSRKPEPAAAGHDASQRAARAAAEAATAELEVLSATERTRKAIEACQATDAELAAARGAEQEKRVAWTTAATKAANQALSAARAARIAAQCLAPPPEPSPPKNREPWEPLDLLDSVPAELA